MAAKDTSAWWIGYNADQVTFKACLNNAKDQQ